MTFRSIFPLLLFVLPSALSGQGANAPLQRGNDALAAGLWEVAALHFNESLADKELPPDEKSEATIRLAEAWIRDGKPAAAMELLGQSILDGHPETPFWKGQALIGLGRFSNAVEVLSPLARNPAARFHHEAAFTTANLELALDKPQAALATLAQLNDSADPAVAARARLHQVEILLETEQLAEARKLMPAPTSTSLQDTPLATFLEANLLLKEDRPAEAASGFQTLIDQPQGQTLRRHHAAAIGLCDSLRANDTPELAADFLLNFIQEHPESPQLESMFKRLQDALPESPSLTDPILERLAQWIPPAYIPSTGLIATMDGSAASAWPQDTQANDLIAFALHTRALGLHRIGTPEARAEARFLLTRLRLENPEHFLSSRALLLTARWLLEEGYTDRAFSLLETLRDTATSPLIQGQAAFLQARSAYEQGDKSHSARLFDEAARALTGAEANAARLNAAIIRLSDAPAVSPEPPDDPSLAADLELERALSTVDPRSRRGAIEDFLTSHPTHPRMQEARLAAAEAALTGPAPDLSFARAQVDTLTADQQTPASLDPERLAMLKLRIADRSNDAPAAIAAARSILDEYPAGPTAADAAFILGSNLFQTRSYNDARLVLEKLAASDTDPPRAEAAWLLAARAAALVPTKQSQEEALTLFNKAIASQGPVAALAKLEKARLMIDLNRLAEATEFLRKWFDELPDADPLHLPAGFLLGEAIYAQGSSNPHSLTEALAVYDKLSEQAENHPEIFNRLQFLRGQALEKIPRENDPAGTKDKEAFIAYYSVLETGSPPAEWEYFERCGNQALRLLESAGRWRAAINCARKIASFNGPNAQAAEERARQLQLEHMIWED